MHSYVLSDVCSTPKYWSGLQNITINVGTTERLFELYSPWYSRGPPEYITGPPMRRDRGVVINWHGCNDHAPILDYHNEISKVTQVAMDRSYFTITPLGTKAGGNYGWNADGIACGSIGVDDFQFFEALIDFINQDICADDTKVYSVGFSTGAFLSYGIACRYPNLIAAIGTDAGGLSHSYLKECRGGIGAVPVQAFHSLADPTVPYDGNAIWAGQAAVDEMWRERNGCDGTEVPIVSFSSDTTSCQFWNCSLAPVESCLLQDIDHCWYGGRSGGFPVCKPRSGDIDATTHMFDFWERI